MSAPDLDPSIDPQIGVDTDEAPLRLAIDPAIFVHPATIRWTLTAIGLGAFALWPSGAGRALGDLVAIWLAVVAVTMFYSAVRNPNERWQNLAIGTALVGASTLLAAFESDGQFRPARVIAALVAIIALYQLGRALHSEQRRVLPMLVLLLAAVMMYAFPRELSGLLVGGLAVSSATLAAITIAQLNRLPPSERAGVGAMQLAGTWFAERPKSADAREDLYGKILYDGDEYSRRVARFFALMGFASAIAALGVVTDSTAVVIGAMLIAPLMTPLMGFAISLSMGWPRHLGRSAAIAAAGVLWAILIGVALGALLGDFIDLATNSQVQARISPTPIDLLVAVAAGGAGAFGLSRPDVSDALPGVAIAISLVPPLSVVGICYSQGAWTEGNGALLLFLTNALAIIVIGSVTFVLTGVTPLHRATAGRERVRSAALAIGALALVVLGGLFLNGQALITQAFAEGQVRSSVTAWVSNADGYEVTDLDIEPDAIVVTVLGPFDVSPPTSDDLAERLDQSLRRDVTVEVRVIKTERERTP